MCVISTLVDNQHPGSLHLNKLTKVFWYSLAYANEAPHVCTPTAHHALLVTAHVLLTRCLRSFTSYSLTTCAPSLLAHSLPALLHFLLTRCLHSFTSCSLTTCAPSLLAHSLPALLHFLLTRCLHSFTSCSLATCAPSLLAH